MTIVLVLWVAFGVFTWIHCWKEFHHVPYLRPGILDLVVLMFLAPVFYLVRLFHE